MKAKIRDVKPKDLKRIFTMEDGVFGDDSFTQDLFKKLIRKNLFFLKIERKKNLIGFIIVIKDREDRANIINFVIDPIHQLKGYGMILLKKAIEMIKTFNEIKWLVLNVNTNNHVALNLYKKVNFKIIKRLENYYQTGNDSYLMELSLKS